ncbi:MAG: prepilin-type N-terminal cleavage/methylation domain-containing protein [Acidimicrobiia bacterium]
MNHKGSAQSRSDDGYTFIEITLVILILALLIAIGLPAFLGAKSHASNRAAQVSLRHTLTNAKALYADSDSYAKVTPPSLHAVETGLTFLSGVSTGPKVVSVASSPTQVVAVARSQTGVCYAIGDAAGPAGTVFGIIASGASCDATNAPPVPASIPAVQVATIGGGWAQSW